MRKFLNLLILIIYPSILIAQEVDLSKISTLKTKHTIIANKKTNELLIFKDHILEKTISMSYGKRNGDKMKEWDRKTPEGIYFITDHFNKNKLKKLAGISYKKYGSGAFVLNYPNPFDKKEKKTGSGIWIHSTDYTERLKNKQISEGCLVIDNSFIDYLKDIITINETPLLIFNDFYSFYKKLNAQLELKDTIIHPKYLVKKHKNKIDYQELNL